MGKDVEELRDEQKKKGHERRVEAGMKKASDRRARAAEIKAAGPHSSKRGKW